MKSLYTIIIALLAFSPFSEKNTPIPRHMPEDPGARWGHTLIYDPVRDEVLLFGGAEKRGSYLGDTWTWDGDTWTQHTSEGPENRGFAASTFHHKRGTVILHGGRGNGNITFSDTWEWDGSFWKKLEEESSFKSDHHEISYLNHSNQILGFGGWTGTEVSGKTWIWNGKWEEMAGVNPPKRSAFGMAYDSENQKVVLYGGLWINGQYADIWEWRNNQWSQLGGPYDQSSLDHHSIIYDSKKGQTLVFGGKNYRYVMQNKLLEISGKEITEITREGPSIRHSIGITYNSKTGNTILYGGKEYKDGEQLPLGDLWIWNGEKWSELY